VLGGMLVLCLGYLVWGPIAPRFVPAGVAVPKG
jgi:hypothetical protein